MTIDSGARTTLNPTETVRLCIHLIACTCEAVVPGYRRLGPPSFLHAVANTANLAEIIDGASGTLTDGAALDIKHIDTLTAEIRAGSIAMSKGSIDYLVAQIIRREVKKQYLDVVRRLQMSLAD